MTYTRHGLTHHPLYSTWNKMKQRCYNKKSDSYENYGGRGIAVCDEWRESVKQFIEDMDPKPTPTHSIDRKDNDKDYSRENCRWATGAEQQRNKRQRECSSGVTGVYLHKPSGKWLAQLKAGGKRINLGSFNSISDAAQARKEGEIKYWNIEGES